MKFLIYGSKGWIGSQVVEILEKQKLDFFKGKSRLDNFKDLENEIKEIKPTHIMMFTGRTSGNIGKKNYNTIDYLEQKGKIYENVRDNMFSPLNVFILSQKYNIHTTYLGTGCIFTYDKDHPYGKEINGFKEDDKPNFFDSSYSVVKGFTDRISKQFENVLNVRIRMPITGDNNTKNFITKITKYEKICSVPNSMTVLPELLPVMIDMAKKNKTGTINLVNPGLISHNKILEMYKEYIDNDFKWNNFTYNEQMEILSAGRSNNYLSTEKLEKEYPEVKNIKDSIEEILKNMKLNYK